MLSVKTPCLVAIVGPAGVGKTELALQHMGRDIDGFCWYINAQDLESVMRGYNEIAQSLGLPTSNNMSELKQSILDRCSSKLKMLVFDNVESASWWRESGIVLDDSIVYVTSQSSDWTGTAEFIIQLKAFEPESLGAEFLFERCPTSGTFREAADVAIALGGYPLALEQAAAYICNTGESFNGYLQVFQDELRTKIFDEKESKPRSTYPQSLVKSIVLSISRVAKSSSIDLLGLIALLDPSDIDISFLQQLGAEVLVDGNVTTFSRSGINASIAPLLNFSLIKRDGDHISIHRLLQGIVRDHLERPMLLCEDVVAALNRQFIFDETKPETWAVANKLVRHAMSVLLSRADRADLRFSSSQLAEFMTLSSTTLNYLNYKCLSNLSFMLGNKIANFVKAQENGNRILSFEEQFPIKTAVIQFYRYFAIAAELQNESALAETILTNITEETRGIFQSGRKTEASAFIHTTMLYSLAGVLERQGKKTDSKIAMEEADLLIDYLQSLGNQLTPESRYVCAMRMWSQGLNSIEAENFDIAKERFLAGINVLGIAPGNQAYDINLLLIKCRLELGLSSLPQQTQEERLRLARLALTTVDTALDIAPKLVSAIGQKVAVLQRIGLLELDGSMAAPSDQMKETLKVIIAELKGLDSSEVSVAILIGDVFYQFANHYFFNDWDDEFALHLILISHDRLSFAMKNAPSVEVANKGKALRALHEAFERKRIESEKRSE